ncbi:MAG: hypothetical protein JWM68_1362, partial [Verrucomicrobiales bacterium]|nr:hypothetical protein [Verrucomicrobiales bacterium]
MNWFKKCLWLLVGMTGGFGVLAETLPIQPLDLKAFVGKSQFTRFNIEWALPLG